jgi:hypothetical protein
MLNQNGHFIQGIKKYWLPTYIQEETEKFIRQVDNLSAEVQELKSELEDI